MIGRIVLLILSLSLAGCGTQKAVAPSWVSSKPIDENGTFVYGIGSSFVSPNVAYQKLAQQNALSDLASELESQLRDKSVFVQQENRGGFNSYFTSETELSTQVLLEDYTLVDNFSDGLRYFVLYKLNVREHQLNKAARMAELSQKIEAMLQDATSTDLPQSLAQRYRILGDALSLAVDGGLVFDQIQGAAFYTDLRRALNEIEQSIDAVIHLPDNMFYLGLPETFHATIKMASNLGSVQELPLLVESSDGSFSWNESGRLSCQHTGNTATLSLQVRIDFKSLFGDQQRNVRKWFETESHFSPNVDVRFQRPTVRVQADAVLESAMRESIFEPFAFDEQGYLELTISQPVYTQASGRTDAVKRGVEGSLQLRIRNTGEVVHFQRVNWSGMGRTKEDADAVMVQDMVDDLYLRFFPFAKRAMGF